MDQAYWREKYKVNFHFTDEQFKILKIDDFKLLYFQRPYNRNLIRNPDASKGFQHWNILQNGGDRWSVDNQSACNPLCDYTNDESTKDAMCWVTSYDTCGKEQIIDLEKRGISAHVLDNVRPDIIISEWYAARYDCGIKYKIEVQLLRNKNDSVPVKQWKFQDTKPAGKDWFKAGYTFSNYDPGVRYIRYYHEGKDTQYWAGWFGAKMTLSSVVVDPCHTVAKPASSS